MEQIQDELDLEIKTTLNKNLSDMVSSSKIITETIRCIAEQSALCKILFSKHGDTEFLRKIMYNAHDQSIAEWTSKQKKSDVAQLEMFYVFIANGIAAIIQNWLQNGMGEKPQEIATFIENATNHGLSYLLDDV